MKYIVERNGSKFIETTSGFKPTNTLIEFTDQIPESDVPYAIVTDVDDTISSPKQAVDVNGDPVFETLQTQSYDVNGDPIFDINGDPVLIDYQSEVIELDVNGDQVMEDVVVGSHKEVTVDVAAKTLAETSNQKNIDKADLKTQRDLDIYNELQLVFLTKDPNSANAYHETWKDMILNPSEYSLLSLICPETLSNSSSTLMFTSGDALDTDIKIQDYATRKIEQATAYGRYRMGRIAQYAAAKLVIENS